MKTRQRIVVTGLIGSIPMAGLTAHYLQYVTGLLRLGHDVLYLEDTGTWTYDPDTEAMTSDSTDSVAYLERTMANFGMADSWRFVDHEGLAHGVTDRSFATFTQDADVFLNVTGAGLITAEIMNIDCRVYIDTDPGFIQMRAANGSAKDLQHLRKHTHHASFGVGIGTVGCDVPALGLTWIPTRQPIDLDLWPVADPPPAGAPFTTVLKWQTYDSVMYQGRSYGLKDVEFRRFIELPQRVDVPFVLAQAGEPPFTDLEDLGWQLISGRASSRSLDEYRSFIHASTAEWSVAKNAYVDLHTGWFGDRSAAYLASGRPVVMQSTGFEHWLPTGCGVHKFTTLEDTVVAVDDVKSSYRRNSEAAREIAQEEFDATRVLSRLLDAVAS